MKMFDLFIALVKAEIYSFNLEINNRNLFDLRAILLNSASMKENARMANKLNEFSKRITPYCCYYSEIEECLGSGRSLKAEEMLRDLTEWGANALNHDVHKLKAFIQSKLEQYESMLLSFLCTPVDDLSMNLRNILDEIPSKPYFTQGADIFNDINKLLNRQKHGDSCWDDNIEAIKINFNLRLSRKLPWVKIKQALRTDCEELLSPSLFSFYCSPKVKEELETLIEGIPSERFALLLEISSMAPIYGVDRVNGLYLSRQSNTMTRRPGQTQVTQTEHQISNLSKFCFG
jgi:hypothetical protein